MSYRYLNTAVVFTYIIGVLLYGMWIGRRQSATRDGYFLGGRRFGWLLIGTSLFAANISSIQYVGQSGLAYKVGICAANPQLMGGIMLVVSAIFFIPVYLRAQFFTIPAFLERRYDRRCKLIYCFTLLAMGMVNVPVMLYAGSLVALQLAGYSETTLPIAACILGGCAGLYAVVGGLASVVYTEFIHSIVLLAGGCLILFYGLRRVGGLHSLLSTLPPGHLHLIQPATHAEMPYTGVLTGLAVSSLFWATSNQDILQRTLAARDLRSGQLGMLLGAFLKLLAIFVLVFPGMIASKLVPGLPPDQAFPAMIQLVLPVGVSGIVLAGLIAALMSSLSSSLLSLSSIFTIDIYPMFDRRINERRALLVGRIVATLILIWGIVVVPSMSKLGLIYPLVLKTVGYLMSSIGVCYIVGRFSRRVNASAAFVTLILGLVVGIILVPLTSVPALMCWVPGWLLRAQYFHVTALLALGYVLFLCVASRFAPPPPAEQLAFLHSPVSSPPHGAGVSSHQAAAGRTLPFWLVVYLLCFGAIYLLFD